jgi:hypothetical protein
MYSFPILFFIICSNSSLALIQALAVDQNRIARQSTEITRPNFIDIITKGAAGAVTTSILLHPSPLSARGRATLEQSYDRYAPRIIAGGAFYKNELKKAIDKNDWIFLKVSECT